MKACDVLLIEPHTDTREALKELFELMDSLSVVAVEDGLQALESLKETRPKIILMDYHIPKINGEDFLTIKANDPEICCIPLIVMTTLPKKVEMMKADFSEMIKKPFELEDFWSCIQKYL